MGEDNDPRPDAIQPAAAGPGADPGLRTPGIARRIRHYKVIRELGQGGMGRVVKSLDTTLNRYVALKMLHPHLSADVEFVERFKKEALAVAKLRHPNVVQIYSIDQDDGVVFFTMEYVEGEGLDSLLSRRGRLDEQEALRIITQAAEGLEHVHSSGILHRDIKSSNLLLDSSGRVMISDFGLAKMDYMQSHKMSVLFSCPDRSAVRAPGETDPETIVGTPYYIAPECLRGREPDFRSDIYSLGIVFYETLAGRLPFQGDTPSDIFRGHMSEMPPPIAELAPETSLKVAGVVYRCMEKDPSLRYQNCESLLRDLREITSGWRMATEIEERKKLSIEIARAMISERRPAAPSRAVGRIAALLMVIALLGVLLLVSADLFKSIPRNLPSASWRDDAAFAPGRPARIAGRVVSVERSGGFVMVRLSRDFEEGRPQAVARLSGKAQDGQIPAGIEPGAALFIEGLVVGGDSPFLRVPGLAFAWTPIRFQVKALEGGAFKIVSAEKMRSSPGVGTVRIRGSVLARTDMTDGATVLVMGDPEEGGVLCLVEPAGGTDFLERDVRIGDTASFEGHCAGTGSDGQVIVRDAVIKEHSPKMAGRE